MHVTKNLERVASVPSFKNPEAQIFLSKKLDLADALSRNQSLCEEAWFELFTSKKIPVQRALSLADRKLSDKQLELLVRKEKRSLVVKAALVRNTVPVFLQEEILQKKYCTSLFAKNWAFSVPKKSLIKDVYLRAGGEPLLLFIKNSLPTELSSKEIEPFLEKRSLWSDNKEAASILAEIVADRPELLPFMVRSPALMLRTVAAGSRFLTKDLQLELIEKGLSALSESDKRAFWFENQSVVKALVFNPVVSLEVVEKANIASVGAGQPYLWQAQVRTDGLIPYISEPYESVSGESLSWLVEKITGSFSVEKSWDLTPLINNPNLTPFDLGKLRNVFDPYFRYNWNSRSNLLYNKSSLKYAVALFAQRENKLEDPKPPLPLKKAHYELSWKDQWTQEEVAAWGIGSLHTQISATRAIAFLDKELGSDIKRWETFFGLVDNFSGTLQELVEITNLL